jgi:hypothetical protein
MSGEKLRLRDMAAPPGFDSAAEVRRVGLWLLATCAAFFFFFLFDYGLSLGGMYEGPDISSFRYHGTAPFFSELLTASALSLLPMPCALVWLLVRNISYFRSSKSYYTMKRLPNRWEYPLRCALLPVGGALALFVSVNLLLLLMGGLYLWATPANMLVAGAEQDVLETVLGGIFA